MYDLFEFIKESNRIEGIVRDPYAYEIEAHDAILSRSEITVADLEWFVSLITDPGAPIRRASGMDVRVGNHVAPPGGPEIPQQLAAILARAKIWAVVQTHIEYETLHPFMDGNGRSGRLLWLWQMGGIKNAPLGFLHHWYYLTLEASR